MRFPIALSRGVLLRRYKRFLSDVRLDNGAEVTAHCANPGAMIGVADPGSEVWLLPSDNPRRKLDWSWELVRVGDHLVGVNTGHPNVVAVEAVAAQKIPELTGYVSIRREVRYGRNSRIDLLLEGPGRPICYVEVKNVHLRRDETAEFPDCVTARGTKHLGELRDVAAAGNRAVMLYVVQRKDCTGFRIAADIDPDYDAALRQARAAGVEVLCYDCRVGLDGIELSEALELGF